MKHLNTKKTQNIPPKPYSKKSLITLNKTPQIRNEENLGKRLCCCTQPLLSIATMAVPKQYTNLKINVICWKNVLQNHNGLLFDGKKPTSAWKLPTLRSSKALSNLCILMNIHFLYSYLLQKAKNGIVLQVRNIQLQFRFFFSLVFHPIQNLSEI